MIDDIISAVFEDPQVIIFFVVGLIVPSAFVINMIAGGAILDATGHGILGSFFTTIGNAANDITGAIGLALMKPAIYLFAAISIGSAIYGAICTIIFGP